MRGASSGISITDKRLGANTMSDPLYLIVSQSCHECGGNLVARLMSQVPSDTDVRQNEQKLGGMYCIVTETMQIEADGDPVYFDFYNRKA